MYTWNRACRYIFTQAQGISNMHNNYLNKPNPLTAGAVHIRFLHFILAHYISAFKPVKDKKWH